MTPIRLTSAVLAVAALILAGCSQASPSSTPASSAPASSTATAASPSPSPTPTGRLTIKQAKRVYVSIVDPSNALVDAINRDETDSAPIAQFHRDTRALIAAEKVMDRKLAAVRWPIRVAPYSAAMRSTDLVADRHCDQALLRAGSYDEANQIETTNTWCTAAQTTTNADQIRTLLHLPPANG